MSLVVVVIENGHVPAPTLYLSLAGSTALIWETQSSQMCVTHGLVLVSITEIMFITYETFINGSVDTTDQWFEVLLIVVTARV